MPLLADLAVPLMTTYNGADRVGSGIRTYLGRPNTWGMRYANVLLQQADVIVALGTRLGLQQTGFNWQEFAPLAKVVQVDIDPAELAKGHPSVDLALAVDANDLITRLAAGMPPLQVADWLEFAAEVRAALPVVEESNSHHDGFLDPYQFFLDLSVACNSADAVIPCSSGGAFTVFYQSFLQKTGQLILSDKSLASMGYGLAGAIGAAVAHPGRRTIHIEGDGGFAQNMQELGTVAVNALPIKTFLFANDGYASIRMTQQNYFDGQYLGCDRSSGLGLPDWSGLAQAFGIPAMTLDADWRQSSRFVTSSTKPVQHCSSSRSTLSRPTFQRSAAACSQDGTMVSNPLHRYSPDLEPSVAARVLPYLAVTIPHWTDYVFDLDGTLVDSRAGIEWAADAAVGRVLPGQSLVGFSSAIGARGAGSLRALPPGCNCRRARPQRLPPSASSTTVTDGVNQRLTQASTLVSSH